MNTIFDKIIVKPQAASALSNVLAIPDGVVDELPISGRVVAVGPDCKVIKPGMFVRFPKNQGTWMEVDFMRYKVMKEMDVQTYD